MHWSDVQQATVHSQVYPEDYDLHKKCVNLTHVQVFDTRSHFLPCVNREPGYGVRTRARAARARVRGGTQGQVLAKCYRSLLCVSLYYIFMWGNDLTLFSNGDET